MKMLAFLVYIIVQIIFLPIALFGMFLVVLKQLFISRIFGISSTAIDVISVRWGMNKFGIRTDIASEKLFKKLPNTSELGYRMVYFPHYLRYKISGTYNGIFQIKKPGYEKFTNPITSRTLIFDEYIKKYKNQAKQLVILGAGFETRCYGDLASKNLNLFELDLPRTQGIKKTALKRAGIDYSKVTFVGVDFSNMNWYKEVIETSLNPTLETIFLIEGLTPYLTKEEVKNIVSVISKSSGIGSHILIDFYSNRVIKHNCLIFSNERYRFGMDLNSNVKPDLNDLFENINIEILDFHYQGSKSKKGPYAVILDILIKNHQ